MIDTFLFFGRVAGFMEVASAICGIHHPLVAS